MMQQELLDEFQIQKQFIKIISYYNGITSGSNTGISTKTHNPIGYLEEVEKVEMEQFELKDGHWIMII